MDIKIVFLNGNLKEEIYMDQPIGFYQRDKRTRCVVLKDSYMVLSDLSDLGSLGSMKP